MNFSSLKQKIVLIERRMLSQSKHGTPFWMSEKLQQAKTSDRSFKMSDNRSYDGSDNNQTHADWGKAGVALLRKAAADYADGIQSLPTRGGTNPRAISNTVCKQNNPNPNPQNLSNVVWAWGQFLDHEMDLTEPPAEGGQSENIIVSQGDPDLPQGGEIPFTRSEAVHGTGVSGVPREQANNLSAYIDGANVYGASETRASALRMNDGSGRLKVTVNVDHGDLLPFNTEGLPNAAPAGTNPADFFLAGDIRANEHAVLCSMHTLFMREHNRLCTQIVADDPSMSTKDEAIFQKARKIVGGIMEVITYNEFLPAILGANAIPAYGGYNAKLNAGINTEFSTACYRVGHTMLTNVLDMGESGSATMKLQDSFFKPSLLVNDGIEAFLGGLYRGRMQRIDVEIIDGVRVHLFDALDRKTKTMLDLAALNIQRGRDHGLPDYNKCREAYGLARKKDFNDITSENKIANKLRQAYNKIENVDPWVGSLAEDHVPGGSVGELIRAVLVDQFVRLRDGDRFWYQNDPGLSDAEKASITATRLSDVMRRNTTLSQVPDDVFHV